jgi:hypothetical protein
MGKCNSTRAIKYLFLFIRNSNENFLSDEYLKVQCHSNAMPEIIS